MFKYDQALRPNLLNGKLDNFFWVLTNLAFCWCLVNLLLNALVSFVLNSWALLADPWCNSPATLFLAFSLKIVKCLAIFFLTI
jgi:hypothetical protein